MMRQQKAIVENFGGGDLQREASELDIDYGNRLFSKKAFAAILLMPAGAAGARRARGARASYKKAQLLSTTSAQTDGNAKEPYLYRSGASNEFNRMFLSLYRNEKGGKK